MAYSVAAEYTTVKEVNDFMGFGCANEEYDVDSDSGASEANPDRLYVGATKVPIFSIGMKVRVWDTSNPIGEDIEVLSIGSDYIQATADLVGDYETDDFAKWKLLHRFSNRSNPTWEWVETEIKKAQDDLDRRMRSSFLQYGRRYEEWHDFLPRLKRRYPTSRVYPFYPSDVFWKIELKHYPIKEFTTTELDHIYLYTGSSIIDLMDGTGTYTEWTPDSSDSRVSHDFWVDYEHGCIYLNKTRPRYGLQAVKVVYRASGYDTYFGDDSEGEPTNRIPYDVNEAAQMWVGCRLLWMERYANNTPSGDGNGAVDIMRQIQEWKDEIERITSGYREIPFYGRGK